MEKPTTDIDRKILDLTAKWGISGTTRTTDQAWQALQSSLLDNSEAQVVPLSARSRFHWLAIAAGFAFLLAGGYYFAFLNSTTLSFNNPENSAERFELPDGSTLVLGRESTAHFKHHRTSGKRELELNGRAFLEVAKGEAFVVLGSEGRVEVLGTSFDVVTQHKVFEVACKTGKVRVVAGNSDATLTSGVGVRNVEGKGLVSFSSHIELIGKWEEGIYQFNEAPILHVLSELSAQFGIKFDYHGDRSIIYSGSFQAENIEHALEIICAPLGLSFNKVAESHYSIKQKNHVETER